MTEAAGRLRGRFGWDLVLIVSLTLALRLVTALPLQRPGYMDPAYYVDGALSLYEGRGFSDPFLWNYLDDPQGIPHPSHLYWMPLSSILAYLSFLALGPTYRAAQVPFGLLSAVLPALSYVVARTVTQSRRHALCAAAFAAFSGFYVVYWVTPDNFAPFAVAGALCLYASGRALETRRLAWFGLCGLCAGLAHLSRADGPLLLIPILAIGGLRLVRRQQQCSSLAGGLAVLALGYLIVMGPWFVRNVQAVGSPISAAGAQGVWLTNYDDLYGYGKALDARSYLAWGWGNILRSKVQALWLNAQTLLFVGWMIFLAPLGLWGVWRLRRLRALHPVWLYGALLYLTMSLAFTFPGWRGGMLHSTAALLPFLHSVAMVGLDACVDWIAQRRPDWRPRRAKVVFSGALVAFAVLLSGFLYARGLDRFQGEHVYDRVERWMSAHLPSAGRVMVNDPATFYYHSRRECLAIPYAELDTMLEVMDRYDAGYLLLSDDYPALRLLYDAPQSDNRLVLLETFYDGTELLHLFEHAGAPVVSSGEGSHLAKQSAADRSGQEAANRLE